MGSNPIIGTLENARFPRKTAFFFSAFLFPVLSDSPQKMDRQTATKRKPKMTLFRRVKEEGDVRRTRLQNPAATANQNQSTVEICGVLSRGRETQGEAFRE